MSDLPSMLIPFFLLQQRAVIQNLIFEILKYTYKDRIFTFLTFIVGVYLLFIEI